MNKASAATQKRSMAGSFWETITGFPMRRSLLLRQILRARDWSGILADVHDFITQVGAVIAAFVGLLLIGVGVVKGVPLAWEEGGRGVKKVFEKVGKIMNPDPQPKPVTPKAGDNEGDPPSTAERQSDTPESSLTGLRSAPRRSYAGDEKTPASRST